MTTPLAAIEKAFRAERRRGHVQPANRQHPAPPPVPETPLATRDGLTGLPDYRAFQSRLDDECRRAARYGTALSVVLLAVDQFPSYTGTHGHTAGDALLKRVADVLRESVRKTDMAARDQAEVFVVILPHTDAHSAQTVAERIRNAVADAPWVLRAVTVSVGVASLGVTAPEMQALLLAAKDALQRSQADGNRVTYRRTLSGECVTL